MNQQEKRIKTFNESVRELIKMYDVLYYKNNLMKMNKKTSSIVVIILIMIFVLGISIDVAFHFLLWSWI